MSTPAQYRASLRPDELPVVPGLEIARGELIPAEYCGDAHDVFVQREPKERAWLWVADASGRDFDASRHALQARACVRSHCLEGASPGEVLARTNRLLHQLGLPGSFLTCVLARWEPERGVLTWSGAGAEAIVIYRAADKSVELIQAGNMALGISEGARAFEDHELRLGPGDALLLATDGLSELRRADGTFVGGFEPVGAALRDRAPGKSAAEIVASLQEWIDQERGGEPPEDELTYLVVKAAAAS